MSKQRSLLEKNQPTTSFSFVKNFNDSASRGESKPDHHHKSADHQNKLQSVAPNDGLEPAN